MRVRNGSTGEEIADHVEIASTPLSRMKGLLGKNSLPRGEGLLITSCRSVHTFGMKFPIDIIFLSRENRVVAVRKNTPPNRLTRIHLSASSVLELPAGTLDSSPISPGDTIILT